MTAVEYFNDEILIHLNFDQRLYLKDIFEQAKEMEKQQIIDAYETGDKYKFAIGFCKWKDKFICNNCNGDGYTIEVEAECCMQRNDYCCGIPIPIQVQRGCYCNNTTTEELLEIYKKENNL